MNIDVPNENKFLNLLNRKSSEHILSKYLEKYPWTILWTFNPTGGHYKYVFREFPLGNKYRIDFVTLNVDSGSWNATLIELEPCASSIFNKNRTPSRTLAIAIRQVGDWKEFIEDNNKLVREIFYDRIKRKDLLKNSGIIPRSHIVHYDILNPNAVIHFEYKIVIGRRLRDLPYWKDPRARYRSENGIEIVSYDRILDQIKTFNRK